MICSRGHDDLQHYLSNLQNRINILSFFKADEQPLTLPCNEELGIDGGGKEYQIKEPYEHEINIDYLDIFRTKSQSINCFAIWEIKPELKELGDTLRQIKRYERIVQNHFATPNTAKIIIYNVSKISFVTIKQYFNPEKVCVFQVTPDICKPLEELQ